MDAAVIRPMDGLLAHNDGAQLEQYVYSGTCLRSVHISLHTGVTQLARAHIFDEKL